MGLPLEPRSRIGLPHPCDGNSIDGCRKCTRHAVLTLVTAVKGEMQSRWKIAKDSQGEVENEGTYVALSEEIMVTFGRNNKRR